MKKIISILFTVLVCGSLLTSVVHAEKKAPVYADSLKDGSYSISVDSSSNMFRIVDCQLTVSNGKMNAVMTLSGTGYEKLFMGTGEKAAAASDEEYIYFTENAEGKYAYTVPVEALDKDIDCAAWSIKKQKWYDRTIVFESASLPDSAIKSGFNKLIIIIPAAAIVLIAAAVFTIRKIKRKTKNAD